MRQECGHDPLLVRLAGLAELYSVSDPNTALFKLRQLGEVLLQRTAAHAGVTPGGDGSQHSLIRELSGQGILPREVADLFHLLRTSGNEAVHGFGGTQGEVIHQLKVARELALALDQGGYSEAALRTAWRDATNQDIAASIVGYVRRAALGEPLLPYEERVRRAMQRILGSRYWSAPQRQWLTRIGEQMVRETVVDRPALDSGQFREVGGGFKRIDRIFEGRLEQVVAEIHDQVWRDAG